MPHDEAIDAEALGPGLPVIPPGEAGAFRLTVEQRETVWYFCREVTWAYPFNVLREGDKGWMSSTPQEVHDILEGLKGVGPGGNILVGGLGLGLFVRLLWRKVPVASVTAVELSPEMIGLVAPFLREERVALGVEAPLEVVQGDVEAFLKETHRCFDFIYLDLWPAGNYLYLPHVTRLGELAQTRLTLRGVVRFWGGPEKLEEALRKDLRSMTRLWDACVRMREDPLEREGVKERCPYFMPFVDWLSVQRLPPEGQRLNERIDQEVEAFRKGEREGLKGTDHVPPGHPPAR